MERWQARVEGTEGAHISLKFEYDRKLSRRCPMNANVKLTMKSLFADDGSLLASTRTGADRIVREYQKCSDYGLTVNRI